jgi:O-antigen/teichoic acid export membrane protein
MPRLSASDSAPATAPPPSGADLAAAEGRFDVRDGGLRRHTARGTIVNAVFLTGVSSLGFLKGLVVAAFLTRTDYGVWGILLVGLGTLAWLKEVGISDKYVQQAEGDQRLAFQKALTLELMFSGALFALMLAVVPLLALIYDQIVAPGLVLTLIVPAISFQIPLAVFYRRMEFVRQRTLQAFDPIVAFVLTVGLAVAGAGYWSFVIGAVAGAWAAALAAWRACPYPLRLRYERGTALQYVGFSWPLLAASLGGMIVAQGGILIGNAYVGLAGVGAIALAANIIQLAQRVDAIVTGTLYPAICAVRERTDLLFESFVKSNRLAVMWGMPFGLAVALFAGDLIEFGIGERWRPALFLLQVFGLAAAINQVGFNWDAYFRARGDTRPIAVVHLLAAAVFIAACIPLTAAEGLDGFALAMGISTLALLAGRAYFLTRLFKGFDMARHLARALAPSVPAVGAVLALRLAESGERTLGLALGELALYLALTALATWVFERNLLREVLGYLRSAEGRPAAA